MASLQKIKSRISTVESIRKITHAMELVSTSKMRKAREYFNSVSDYETQVREIVDSFFARITPEELREYFVKKTSKKRIYIVISSDLGLAGSYNFNIVKLVRSTIKEDDELIVLGSKGINALEHKYKKQIVLATSWAHASHSDLAYAFTKLVVDKYRKNEVGEIHIIYNEFVNNLIQQETDIKIMPYHAKPAPKSNDNFNQLIEFEPNTREILINTLPLFISAKINLAIASAVISEYASRRSAMETATDNADELIDNLNLDYNRKRQSNITQELNEIVGGANAV
ncbi:MULTISPECIES: ATP synthase F1 subunit gamma [unclassified Mycoplasma]|uniref:ATP synthase F1 subunit gamma n=1 Tax=unclassified Mycoplasma TaxID=2683645 RepID=UPI00216B4858|nr:MULTISPECIES: ATP synthase F1 subunit gamma [unclassified Mycoplasma]MCS4537098.1 ATP synthase F1 subunit gamma [Mycoplasma sp. CSL7475-4]MCT4469786.1 ATP synthase F1 subunit gamma [Mycoplasma sp. HS2188]